MGSRGKVVACMIPMGRGEEEPRGAGAGLPDVGLALPGKATLTYPDGEYLCDAPRLPAYPPSMYHYLSGPSPM